MNGMKKYLIAAVLVTLAAMPLRAQKTAEEYASRYNLLADRLGPTGVGIETLVTRWEKDFPDDVSMLCAKFSYYYGKSMSSRIVKKDQKKFMGNSPVLSLDDSTGVKTNYFEEVFYDDSLYAIASSALDRAVRLSSDDLYLRVSKINSLLSYEKESPDMATQTIVSLIDYNYTKKPAWNYSGQSLTQDQFCDMMQEFCVTFYTIGSPAAMESFRKVSEKMSSYNPKKTCFLDNLGSYHLVCAGDNKTALKYYSKALKIDPKDYSAIKNSVLIARKDKNVKLEKKYLPMLIGATEDESEKLAAKVRLEALSK